MPEIFECSNCYKRDRLDTHGRCSHCGSNAVISLYALRQHEEEAILADIFTHGELETLFGIVNGKIGRA